VGFVRLDGDDGTRTGAGIGPGDQFAAFCRGAYPQLVAALHAMTGDADLAEELAQEGLERAYARWDRVGSMANPTGWVFTVAANLARSRFRRARAERRAQARHGPATEVRHDSDVADALAVRAALAELNDAQRRVVVLRHVLQLTPDEVAAVTGATPGAVRTMTSRAMQRLRDQLDREAAR
jgi:RNA polymerase sigma-70 factor (sigma-E family)